MIQKNSKDTIYSLDNKVSNLVKLYIVDEIGLVSMELKEFNDDNCVP